MAGAGLAAQPERVHTKTTAEEEAVRHAVITGNYEMADALLFAHYAQDDQMADALFFAHYAQNDQMADALLFAHYAQDDLLWEMVTRRYLEQHASAFTPRASSPSSWPRRRSTSGARRWPSC